jgi:hypothetical protein
VTDNSLGRSAPARRESAHHAFAFKRSPVVRLTYPNDALEPIDKRSFKVVSEREFERMEAQLHELREKLVRRSSRVKGLPAGLVTTRQLKQALEDAGHTVSDSTIGRYRRAGLIAPSTDVVKSGGRGRPEKTWPRDETLSAIETALSSL